MNIPKFSLAKGSAFLIAFLLGTSGVSASLLNRWSFNEAAGAVTAGTVLADSVSSLPMNVRGQGASRDGTRISLPGTTTGGAAEAAISAYLDLPNGVISTKTHFTFECWASPLAGRDWAPLCDFGRMNIAGDGLGAPGEWTGNSAATPPGGTQAEDALTLLLSRGTDLNLQRQGTTLNGVRTDLDTNLPTTAGQIYHYVLTVTDNANGMQVAWYRDGVLAGSRDLAFHLNAIEDVNCWLGRLQWTSLGMASVAYDEVRLYNHAFTPAEVVASRDAGPNAVFPPPIANADAATMHLGQKVRLSVLANDTGIINAATVAIVQPPQHGTAVADSTGTVLYTHTSGTPVNDSFSYTVSGAGGASAPANVAITFATSLRIPNANLNVPATPPATTYTTAAAFATLTFNQPINLATVPGDTQRLFVVQRGGVIRMIPSVTAPSASSSVFLDLATLCSSRGETLLTSVDRGLMSMAFHPQHASNGRFFVWYSVAVAGQNYYRISRFNVQAGDPNQADSTSEAVLIQQLEPNGFHLGTDMHFGTDGYLYVSAGDGGGQNDSRRNGQRIDLNFHCALMRLDVDKLPGNPEPNLHASVPRDGGLARYAVPADNPFVTANPTVSFNGQDLPAANVRTEFYSVGLRNPFRFSIDAPTGEIWVGDVGQDAREEINLATNGGNFGWSWREGTIAGPNAGEALPGFTYTNPLYEYVVGNGSFQGHSVTGGIVYRGTNLPSLTGAYIFADYVDGHLWALRRTPGVAVERLTGNAGFVAFCADPSNGDVLAADIQEGRIYRLVAGSDTGGYPTTLSATGLFADVATLSPAPGLLPYSPNLSFWSDFAIKRRWFIVPDASTLTWAREGAWTYPDGMIWVKHFDLETTRGNPATVQRIETRVLVKNASGSYGVSYRWNAAQTEATLVADGGESFDIDVIENGIPRVQHYRIPSRGECITCHNAGAGPALSFNTRQLNRSATMNGFVGNQIDLLHQAGYFANTPEPTNVLPRHVRPDETQFPLEARVRSYLAVNCANCHAAGLAIAPASWDARPNVSLADTLLINGPATQNGGNPANRLIVPGDPNHSIVLNRIAATNGFTRMPPLGSNELDQANIALLTDWIANALPSRQTYADWRLAQFGSPNSPEGEAEADPDGDQRANRDEYLTGTNPLFGSAELAPSVSVIEGAVTLSLTLPPDRSFQVESSIDLVNWFLWDVPGNQGLPSQGGQVNLMAPRNDSQRFFRVRLWEN